MPAQTGMHARDALTATVSGLAPPSQCCRDTDPDGVQLAAHPDPLGEAFKLVKRLVEHAGDSLTTHLLAFEVREGMRVACSATAGG